MEMKKVSQVNGKITCKMCSGTRVDRRPVYRDKYASVLTEEEVELSILEKVRIAVRSLKNISAPGWTGHHNHHQQQQHRHVQLEVQHNLVQTIWKKEAVPEDCTISLFRSFG